MQMRSDTHVDLRKYVWENKKIETNVNVKLNVRLFSSAHSHTCALCFCERVRLYLYKKMMQLISPQFT